MAHSFLRRRSLALQRRATGWGGDACLCFSLTRELLHNKRLQPINMSASTTAQTVFSIGYDFHVGNGTTGADNGNVWSIYNYRDRTRDHSPMTRSTA